MINNEERDNLLMASVGAASLRQQSWKLLMQAVKLSMVTWNCIHFRVYYVTQDPRAL